ncbi:MAG: UDP-N-acetylmuramate--L-alanine ligase [Firmicutes bacterium]|nr:UDP-N-acetylmuramate--L-alanine ligase [Bacillota bacterium]
MKEKNFHFIGIGGIGMSGIAKIMLEQGYSISGSDVKNSALIEALRAQGANIDIGHAAENVPADTDCVVYSTAVAMDNPEMQVAKERGLKILKRAEMLGFLMSTRSGIGVAGSHGKTTTSGMISLMLEEGGAEPTIIIGGTLPQIGSNAKGGSGRYLVAEADESDGTFLLLNPEIAVITNIEEDHMDHYESLDEIKEAFAQYVRQLPQSGYAVINLDCPHNREIYEQVPASYITYALDNTADYQARDIRYDESGSYCNVFFKNEFLGELHLQVPGRHNVSNALAAVCVGRICGLEFAAIAEGLKHFRGTGRRFELLGKVNGITIIDDYAHHPTEVKATVSAVRNMHKGRLIAVFQPHRYSRTQAMKTEFAHSFAECDMALIAQIYEAFEKPIEGVSARNIVAEAAKAGYKHISYGGTKEEICKTLAEIVREDDIVLIMGAGDIRKCGEDLVRELSGLKTLTK